jgi:nucleotide-binding universal stress UspA family protein
MKTTETSPIVCGTDFSENADKAAAVADALARRLGAPCILAHSVDERGEFPENIRPRLMNDDRPRLAEHAERLRGLGLAFEEKLLRGVPDDGVAHFTAQTGARLVVVGASVMGSHWLGRLLLGNISARIAESAPAPTLVVHDAAPFVAWARGERSLKIFVGVDFSTSSDAALRWIAELRQIGPCEVIAGYVDWPPEEAARLGVSGPVGLDENPPAIQQTLERDVREKVTRLLGAENVLVCVRANSGRADAPLLEMAVEAQADLVVIGTHQWHGLSRFRHGSVSRAILRHAPMSVACVPAPAAAPVSGPRVRECPRVFVAVDVTEPHGFASRYAYGITAPGGTVCLMHNLGPAESPDPATQSHPASLIAEAETKLRALTPHEAEARGIATEVEVTTNCETAAAICAAAERFGADIICIGSHTRPGFTAKALGSVSLAVLQASRRPVLVVWPPVE